MIWRVLAIVGNENNLENPSHSRVKATIFYCSFFFRELFMKIVKLNRQFLEESLTINQNLNYGGIGLAINIRGEYIYIPMTSKIKYDENKLNDLNYPFFNIGEKRKYGTLNIKDYIYVHHSVITNVEESKLINDEIIFFKKNRNIIEKKIIRRINKYKQSYDIKAKEFLNNFLSIRTESARNEAEKYTQKLIDSMAMLEKVNFSKEDLEKIIEYKVMERVDTYDIYTILNLKTAWTDIIRTLDKKLTLDYIVDINKTIAIHQALIVGELRNGINSVGGEFEIEIPNKDKILKFIDNINVVINEGITTKIEDIAISLFHNIVTNQWFYDGNKRTGFAIMNKILIQNGIGIVLITEEVEKEFSEKLYSCYKERNEKSKKEFIDFIKNFCYIEFNITR